MFELVFLCNLDNTANERNLSYFQGLIEVKITLVKLIITFINKW